MRYRCCGVLMERRLARELLLLNYFALNRLVELKAYVVVREFIHSHVVFLVVDFFVRRV